ncbi:hypothetical protein FOA52_010249 [Chlamydomonas sp. UWO 241]|nr:hypothetical protein FOA52_010249 [Chlamydomonas sp. UWO 241]
MDWDKKASLVRPQLAGAANDTFNTMMTPGQSLLRSLQDAEGVRKQKLGETLGAKMKAAREQLPSLSPKHALRSDMSIFSSPPPAEVHSLLNNTRKAKADMSGVKSMLEVKMDCHQAVSDEFFHTRDDSKAQLEAGVSTLAGELREALAASDSACNDEMSALAEDCVMNLTEADVYNVWDAVAQQIPQRAAWIEELAQGLEEAEEMRREIVEAALVTMVAGMNGVAHLSEGEVERILERESLALNLAILNNRRAYAELVKRLQLSEVEAERAHRQEWERGLSRWRILRTHHAMKVFNERILSSEYTEPAARLHAFDALRDRQRVAFASVVQHVQQASGLTPPHMSFARVSEWRAGGEKLHGRWLSEVAGWMGELQRQEDGIEGTVQGQLGQLVEEVLAYRGYEEEELRALVAKDCGSVVAQRRADAVAMVSAARKFLEWQADDWSHFVESLGAWLARVCGLHEDYKTKTGANDASVRTTLKSHRDLYNEEDSAREAALEAAVAAVSAGHSEKALDGLVSNALQRLDDIDAGYRAFHTHMTTIVKDFPRTVMHSASAYHIQLCRLLQVQPQVEPPPPSPEELAAQAEAEQAAAVAAAEAAAAAESETAAAAAAAAAAAKGGKKAAAPPPPPAPEVAEPAPEEGEEAEEAKPPFVHELALPSGLVFLSYTELLSVLINEGAAALGEKLLEAAKREAAAAAIAAAEEAKAAAAAAAAQAEAEAAQAAAAAPPTKGAKAAAAPAAAAAAAAAAATPAEGVESVEDIGAAAAAAVVGPVPPPKPPASSYGAVCCIKVELPRGQLNMALETLQVGMLKDMCEFSNRVTSAAFDWAQGRETGLTEELDARLRSHRPRAGRIEEETRLSRSVELVAQRRRVETHMRAHGKAVQAQADACDEWVAAMKAQVEKLVGRLRGYEAFLGQCLSLKTLDIRKREAEALQQRITRDMAAQVDEIEERIASSCTRLVEANAAFTASELKSFQDGGAYAEANAAAYRKSLSAIDAHVNAARTSQVLKLDTLVGELTTQVDSALEHIQSLLPSHKEDMALIERVDAAMDAARKKAGAELGRSSEDRALIARELDSLEGLLQSADVLQKHLRTPGGGSSLSAPNALASCKEVLGSLDRLRNMLFKQSKSLEFLGSSGLSPAPVALLLDADGEPSPSAAAAAASEAGAKAAADAKKRGLRTVPPPTNMPPPVEPLAKDIEAVIDASLAEVGEVARAYYAMLYKGGKMKPPSAKGKKSEGPVPDRAIRYPARIPSSVDQLLGKTDKELVDLRERLRAHVSSGVKELRTQVIRAYRLVERTPAVALAQLLSHELHATEARRRSTVRKFMKQHDELLAEVDVVRSGLHPRMINPMLRKELDSLLVTEASRSEKFGAMVTAFAGASVHATEEEGQALQRRLAHLVAILVQLLDSFLYPDDLPPIGADEQYVYSLPGRKDDKQLHRLMLANAEAQGVQLPAVEAGKGAKGGKGAAAAAAAAAPDAGGRPFSPLTWSLPAGNFDMVSLGWVEPDGSPAPGVPAVEPSAKPAPGTTVSGLDTPCHRAGIRAYRACLAQGEASMRAGLGSARALLTTWAKDEVLWRKTWAGLLQEMEGL